MRGTGPFARLWVRLLLAFAAVLAVAVLVPAVYARQAARAEFQRYVNTGQQTRRANLAGLLALSYRQNRGSWDAGPRAGWCCASMATAGSPGWRRTARRGRPWLIATRARC